MVTRAVSLHRPLLHATPDQFASWAELAETLVSEAQEQSDSGDSDEACDQFDVPIEIYMHLATAAKDPDYLEAGAQACAWKAVAAVSADRPYAADWAFGQAVSLAETLLRDYGRTHLLEDWANAQIAWASHLARYGHTADAEAVAEKMKAYLKAHHEAEHDRLATEIDQALARARDSQT
jgi:hypothetical protein